MIFNPHDKRTLIQKILGYCDCPCHKRYWFIYPKTIRMNTAYANEQQNWITCCEEFYEDEIAPMWEEAWEDYYNSRF